MDKNTNVDSRLQSAIHGTPKINPDEQRKYLGTFRERVVLTMTVAQIKNNQYRDDFIREMKANSDKSLLINGNLSQNLIGPYMKAASQFSIQFTIKTDSIYATNDKDLALVLTAKQAMNRDNIDIENYVNKETNSKEQKPKSLLDKLKDGFLN